MITVARRHAHRGRSSVVRDYFNRANGALGAAWSTTVDGGLHIASQQVAGDTTTLRSSVRIAESFSGDHYSQIETTSNTLAAGDWVGPAVRCSSDGQNLYTVIYYNDTNSGTYVLQLYKRVSGTYTEIDPFANGTSGYTLNGPLAAGTQIKLSVSGSTITVLLNGVRVMKVSDTSIASGGSPGIVSYGVATAKNWAADAAKPEPAANIQSFTSSPPNSANNGGGHTIKVLTPTPSAVPAGVPHNFLYVLPVDPDGVTTYGDGIDTLYGLNAHNLYNLTIIQPAFAIGSWYANHTTDPTLQHETFMTSDLAPWVTANYTISGTEEHWLIGFSRSGFGGMGLLLKHPTVFTKGAFWDWPFDMTTANYASYGAGTTVYGSDANFTSNYQMTSAFLDAHKTPFQSTNRIWIGGYEAFQADDADADTQLTSKGILHTLDPALSRGHRWDTGWVPSALSALAQMP